MAHEVENMFAVGETPWHGLGTVLQDPPSIKEAIELAGLNWTVSTVPLYTADNRPVEAKATVRDSDNSILAVVGPDYSPLQNAEAFDFFEPFIQSGLATLHTAGSLRNGQRVWVLAKINADPLAIVPGDAVERFVLLSNGHDGKLAVRVGFTPIRVVCANTLSASHSSKASKLIRVKHRGNVKANIDDLRDIMNLANSEFEATAEQYRFLAGKPISEADLLKYVKKVFSVSPVKKGIEVEDNTMHEDTDTGVSRVWSKIQPLIETGRGTDVAGVKGTYWGAYNAVTEFLAYERGNKNTGKDDRLDNLWFGTGLALNDKALHTALHMAQGA